VKLTLFALAPIRFQSFDNKHCSVFRDIGSILRGRRFSKVTASQQTQGFQELGICDRNT
jgi:hypothetical protein